MKTSHPTALITGATSGIGKVFAFRYAGKGYDLILTGRRKKELEGVAATIAGRYPVHVSLMTGDMTDPEYRQRLAGRIRQEEDLEVLVNNAGFGIDRAFDQTAIEEIRSMMYTHMTATVELIHAALPAMIRRSSGTIINVSSLGAFIPGLTRSLYLATKSFVHYFTEALSTEIHRQGIRIQSLCPGMTVTDFHRNNHNEKLQDKLRLIPFMSAEAVVDTSLRSLEHGHVFCIPGVINKLFYTIAKLLPIKLLAAMSGFRK